MPDPDSPRKSLLSFFGLGKPQTQTQADIASGEDHVASELVDHAREFQSLTVADVMTPRVDIVAIELDTNLGDVVRTCIDSEHSRFPIYRETLDDPVGVVHIKDVLKLLGPDTPAQPHWAEPILHRLRREMLYVPTSMMAAELLLRMQSQRIHMALVIDEFGGTSGLATLEDLVEAVVGEIDDEYDEATESDICELPSGQIEVDGRVEVEALEARLDVRLYPEDEEEEIETVAGLVAFLAGRVPQSGEVIPYEAAGFDIEILDADARRIKRLRLHRRSPSEAELTSAHD